MRGPEVGEIIARLDVGQGDDDGFGIRRQSPEILNVDIVFFDAREIEFRAALGSRIVLEVLEAVTGGRAGQNVCPGVARKTINALDGDLLVFVFANGFDEFWRVLAVDHLFKR